MKLHHLGKLAMTTENLPLCSRVRNSRSNVAILPTPQWLLKTPAKFFKERGDSQRSSRKNNCNPTSVSQQLVYLLLGECWLFPWSLESEWKGYVFIKSCLDGACKTSLSLLRRRKLNVDVFQVLACRPVTRMPGIACLNEDTPGLLRAEMVNPSK
jgi:hypothetical protein